MMSDINLTQLHDTGFIPVSSNAMSTSTVDNRNTGKTRDTKETAKLRCVEKLLAQIWPACLLSRNDSVEGERARRERSGWRPRQPPLQARDWVHRLVTRRASVPTGEGAGRQRPGRARSPLSTASFRPRRLDLRALTLVSPPCPNNLARHLRYPELHAQVP